MFECCWPLLTHSAHHLIHACGDLYSAYGICVHVCECVCVCVFTGCATSCFMLGLLTGLCSRFSEEEQTTPLQSFSLSLRCESGGHSPKTTQHLTTFTLTPLLSFCQCPHRQTLSNSKRTKEIAGDCHSCLYCRGISLFLVLLARHSPELIKEGCSQLQNVNTPKPTSST